MLTFPNQNKDEVTMHYDFNEEDIVGRGSFSVVYKAHLKRNTNEEYAIKKVDKKQTHRGEMYCELEIMSKLKHQHIVYFKEIFEDNDSYYVVMELITGGELFDRIITFKHYSEKDTARIMAQCFSAIKYMHQNNIVHRDLKPENILLSSPDLDASVKIADFGFAAYCESNSLLEWLGTPPYMAPEVVALCPNLFSSGPKIPYGKAVDIWSIGVIFYILLSGIHPFQVDDEIRMFKRILSGEIKWVGQCWDKVSASAKELITGMLERSPVQRFSIDQCILHPWLVSATDEDLDIIHDALKTYQAKKRFKAAILGVVATNKMKILVSRLLRSVAVKIRIQVHSGLELAPKDPNGKSDPYVFIFYAEDRKSVV